ISAQTPCRSIVVSKGEWRRPDRQILFVYRSIRRPDFYEQSLPGPGTNSERAMILNRSAFYKHLNHELTKRKNGDVPGHNTAAHCAFGPFIRVSKPANPDAGTRGAENLTIHHRATFVLREISDAVGGETRRPSRF